MIFELDPAGQLTVLHSFPAAARGNSCNPLFGVTLDGSGNLYGATYPLGFNCGVNDAGEIYKLDRAGNFTVLYTFTGGSDGAGPQSLVLDSAGNIYGAANFGGSLGCRSDSPVPGIGCGVVFKVDPSGNESVLYTFTGGAGGNNPAAQILRNRAGNIYGAAERGRGRGSVLFEIMAPQP